MSSGEVLEKTQELLDGGGEKGGEAWVVMPFVDLWKEFTEKAAEDCLAQEGVGEVRLLLVSNGSSEEERRWASEWTRKHFPQALIWHHAPPLPALGGTWNRAVEACYAAGARSVMVVNNDVRLHPQTYAVLRAELEEAGALLVSGVGIGEKDWEDADWGADSVTGMSLARGGPDYSCFVISRRCQEFYPFDICLTYCNDVDHHRRVMLAGDGGRVYAIDAPFLHYGSRTINRSPEALEEHHRTSGKHREYYRKKWGGGVNEERYVRAFDEQGEREGVGTAELFEQVRKEWAGKEKLEKL